MSLAQRLKRRKLQIILFLSFIVFFFAQGSIYEILSTSFSCDNQCKPKRADDPSIFDFDIISGHPCSNQTQILVLVTSSVYRQSFIEVAQKTWARPVVFSNGVRVEFRFLTGSGGNDSSLESNPSIIRGSFKDEFMSGLLKVWLGIRWSKKFCSSASLVVKTMDDVLVAPWNLLSFYADLNHSRFLFEPFYGGSVNVKCARIVRPPKHYGIASDIVPCSRYSDYVRGTMIMFNSRTRDLFLDANMPYSEELYWDDIYLGYLARDAGVSISYWESLSKTDLVECSDITELSPQLQDKTILCRNAEDPAPGLSLFSRLCALPETGSRDSSKSVIKERYCSTFVSEMK